MKLAEYLCGIRAATTADELEGAIQARFKHAYNGRTWSQILRVTSEKGLEICDAHPLGRYVPRLGARHLLTVCDTHYKVGYGQNSTGVRYCWSYAEEWAIGVLLGNGLSRRAAYAVWNSWSRYPHRCLRVLEDALAGKLPDPPLDTLILSYQSGNPIKYTVEQNEADKWDWRANRPCECGGTLFDWGAGYSDGVDFINWHCNKCPRVFTEYLSEGRLSIIRGSARKKAG